MVTNPSHNSLSIFPIPHFLGDGHQGRERRFIQDSGGGGRAHQVSCPDREADRDWDERHSDGHELALGKMRRKRAGNLGFLGDNERKGKIRFGPTHLRPGEGNAVMVRGMVCFGNLGCLGNHERKGKIRFGPTYLRPGDHRVR